MIQYVVDAFTDHVFAGNPAAVCVMEEWLPEETMMSITIENNLSETAFAVKEGEHYHLRWFTPGGEIDLCGHATLATGYIILRFIEPKAEKVTFTTLSGILTVTKKGDLLEMDFPAYDLKEVPVTDAMEDAIGVRPVKAYMGRDLLCVLDKGNEIPDLHPDQEKVEALPGALLHVTGPGEEYDCVSRSFAPKLKIPEDPVCGSGHCHIAPYWAAATGKSELVAYQASPRGGVVYCRVDGDRVRLAGRAAVYSRAELYVR